MDDETTRCTQYQCKNISSSFTSQLLQGGIKPTPRGKDATKIGRLPETSMELTDMGPHE